MRVAVMKGVKEDNYPVHRGQAWTHTHSLSLSHSVLLSVEITYQQEKRHYTNFMELLPLSRYLPKINCPPNYPGKPRPQNKDHKLSTRNG